MKKLVFYVIFFLRYAVYPQAVDSLQLGGRDAIGDFSSQFIKKGDFSGSFKVEGPHNISLRIGGFVKVLGYYDSAMDSGNPIFLPAALPLSNEKNNGRTTFSADLSRVIIDVRAPLKKGSVRGYIENEFTNGGYKLRHAYLLWRNEKSGVVAGQTWSTFMDLQTLFSGVGEPTISGPVFARPVQFRYSRYVQDFTWNLALEGANNADFKVNQAAKTIDRFPDLITSLVWTKSKQVHFQIALLFRNAEIENSQGDVKSAQGLNFHLSSYAYLAPDLKFACGSVFGKGSGRYLLGLTPGSDAGFVDADGSLEQYRNFSLYGALEYTLSPVVKSNLAYGYCEISNSDSLVDYQGLNNTKFLLFNIFLRLNELMTLGVEYDYGAKYAAAKVDNHRIMFGIQLF